MGQMKSSESILYEKKADIHAGAELAMILFRLDQIKKYHLSIQKWNLHPVWCCLAKIPYYKMLISVTSKHFDNNFWYEKMANIMLKC